MVGSCQNNKKKKKKRKIVNCDMDSSVHRTGQLSCERRYMFWMHVISPRVRNDINAFALRYGG